MVWKKRNFIFIIDRHHLSKHTSCSKAFINNYSYLTDVNTHTCEQRKRELRKSSASLAKMQFETYRAFLLTGPPLNFLSSKSLYNFYKRFFLAVVKLHCLTSEKQISHNWLCQGWMSVCSGMLRPLALQWYWQKNWDQASDNKGNFVQNHIFNGIFTKLYFWPFGYSSH